MSLRRCVISPSATTKSKDAGFTQPLTEELALHSMQGTRKAGKLRSVADDRERQKAIMQSRKIPGESSSSTVGFEKGGNDWERRRRRR